MDSQVEINYTLKSINIIQRLCRENDKLNEENNKLKEENEKLKEENEKLGEENDKLKEDNESLKQELKMHYICENMNANLIAELHGEIKNLNEGNKSYDKCKEIVEKSLENNAKLDVIIERLNKLDSSSYT